MKLKILSIFVIFFSVSCIIKGENIIYTKSDSIIYKAYIAQFRGHNDRVLEELLVGTAKCFLEKPYIASTLEVADNELLVVNLREFDCTTFVENCIVLSEVIKSGDTSFDNYCRMLSAIRYRNGKIDGYPSRLHYTSDWIYENQKRGILKNISLEIGGKNVQKTVGFMTTHPESYKHLKNNLQNIEKLKEIEENINRRNNYQIIPKDVIADRQQKIKNGDIIVFATSISGLDYSHIGIAYWQKGKLHFIHASSKFKKVIIEPKTLLDYCQSSKNCMGISVLRIDK